MSNVSQPAGIPRVIAIAFGALFLLGTLAVLTIVLQTGEGYEERIGLTAVEADAFGSGAFMLPPAAFDVDAAVRHSGRSYIWYVRFWMPQNDVTQWCDQICPDRTSHPTKTEVTDRESLEQLVGELPTWFDFERAGVVYRCVGQTKFQWIMIDSTGPVVYLVKVL